MRRLLVAALLIAAPTYAQALELNGQYRQGGLVVGQARPGATVTLDGKAVDVAQNGAFVFGFGRNAGAKATLRVTEGTDVDGKSVV